MRMDKLIKFILGDECPNCECSLKLTNLGEEEPDYIYCPDCGSVFEPDFDRMEKEANEKMI